MRQPWEKGDVILRRTVTDDAVRGKEYAFAVISKRERPFLDMRQMRRPQGGLTLFYRAEGCCSLTDRLISCGRAGQLSLPEYLRLMEKLLTALAQAEELLILLPSFQIDLDTVLFHPASDAVKLAYVPIRYEEAKAEEACGKAVHFRSPGSVLLSLLEQLSDRDCEFCLRWPFLKEQLCELDRHRAGRNRYLALLKRWRREFPGEALQRSCRTEREKYFTNTK